MKLFPHLSKLDDVQLTQRKRRKEEDGETKQPTKKQKGDSDKTLTKKSNGDTAIDSKKIGSVDKERKHQGQYKDKAVEKTKETTVAQENEGLVTPEVIVEKLIKDEPKRKVVPKNQEEPKEYVNLQEERQKKRVQRELSGGYAESSSKHSGVVNIEKRPKSNQQKYEKRVKKAVDFLLLETEEDSIGFGSNK